MGARFFRSTMALVHWVVPSMAWRISLRLTPDCSRTARTAPRIAVIDIAGGVLLDVRHNIQVFIDQDGVGVGAAYINAQLIHAQQPSFAAFFQGDIICINTKVPRADQLNARPEFSTEGSTSGR